MTCSLNQLLTPSLRLSGCFLCFVCDFYVSPCCVVKCRMVVRVEINQLLLFLLFWLKEVQFWLNLFSWRIFMEYMREHRVKTTQNLKVAALNHTRILFRSVNSKKWGQANELKSKSFLRRSKAFQWRSAQSNQKNNDGNGNWLEISGSDRTDVTHQRDPF